ncbi:Vms1/Ankzf1 family peptidyl-tRNA hydrolase [Streptomyces sp. VRA16 Mangrove soil]|uniref:baeRF2 domain-containing protein n=1 Tax=Streptomyces sp. VRA16 Mangrove soil TaxID=2817434 RepID=UPI001A9D064C|nr:Vms1/Ankzf1 family peptidyl-tRNA hydrolase [Streptomyces sp. VRA16 Mangrove soil]MBO1330503.1 hypothetical protein [Streptomyces sp. VRA16 Mangrove soil]
MDLSHLTPLCERPGPWASVYVDTSAHSESTALERSVEATAVQRTLKTAGADDETCRAVRTAVDEMRHTREPVGRALFATQGEVVLDLPLSTPPTASAQWAPMPRTTPLLDLAGEDPLCLIAHIDRKGAELDLHSAREDRHLGEVSGDQWPVHRAGRNNWAERHFQLRVENTWEHNATEMARALETCQADTRAELILLVGDDRECAAVRDKLPKALRERTVRCRHGAGSRSLGMEIARIQAEHVAYRADRSVGDFAAARGRDGAAASGVPAVVDAARQHRLAELLVRSDGPDTHREVWVGADPDQLATRRTDAVALGAAEPVSARADDALMRCAAAGGASALSVAGAVPGSGPPGGLGALLRWT